MKKFTVAAGEAISLFAQKLGMKLFAAKGKIEIQAQSDDMALTADKNVTMTSANGRIDISAKEEIILKAGGSYIRITPLGIEEGTLGDRTWKADSHRRQGPASLAQEMNGWKQAKFDEQFGVGWGFTQQVPPSQKINMVLGDQGVVAGATDTDGQTTIQKSISADRTGTTYRDRIDCQYEDPVCGSLPD